MGLGQAAINIDRVKIIRNKIFHVQFFLTQINLKFMYFFKLINLKNIQYHLEYCKLKLTEENCNKNKKFNSYI